MQVPYFVVSATLVAVMTAVPVAFAVTTPELDTSAMAVLLDVHVTSLLAKPVVSTVALNADVVFSVSSKVDGTTVTLDTVLSVGTNTTA